MKLNKKIGDSVITNIRRPSGKNLKVKGKIKNISKQFGDIPLYEITEGMVEDFSTRSVE